MVPSAYAAELARVFRAWEERGRGTSLCPSPVALEPPFRPFFHRHLSASESDDGRRPTFLSRISQVVMGGNNPSLLKEESEPAPRPHEEREMVDLRFSLPHDFRPSRDSEEGFLRSLLTLRDPLSWEIVSVAGRIRYSASVSTADRAALRAAVAAYLPGVFLSEDLPLSADWGSASGNARVLEFGLRREFMIPLAARFPSTPLLTFLSVASQIQTGEVLVLQVRFVPARRDWTESILRSVHTPSGTPFFADAPELTRLAEAKVSAPLFAVSLKVGVKASGRDRLRELARLVAGTLAALGRENEFIALEDNPHSEADFLGRRSHRPGMLLSLPELAALVHIPGSDVRVPGLVRGVRTEKAPPREALSSGALLGEVSWKTERIKTFLPEEARLRHTHLIGATGSGKTTLLLNLVMDDIKAGRGVGVIDPHGDMATEILTRIPEERLPDLVLIDPSDPEVSAGWNALQARSETEREVLSSDLVALFRRYSTSWGDQMSAVLGNAVAALLSMPEEYTVSDLRRFLVDRRWRESVIPKISDEELAFFWEKEFSHIGERSLGPILGRLNTFLRSRPIRESVSRPNGIDFRKLLDQGGILIARLPLGLLGEENCAVLGSLLVTKLHQVALSRADLGSGERTPFHLVLDEFHLFATPSLSLILSGARKFGLSLALAHQSLAALHGRLAEVEGSILANCYTRIIFRPGEEDARKLERSLSAFTADDLLDLKTGEAVCRLGAKENDFRISVPLPERVSADREHAARERVRSHLGAAAATELPREAVIPPAPLPTPERPAPPHPRSETPQARAPRPAPPPALGRGGPEHQYLQELIKQWSEDRGYRVMIEKPILDGQGKVDVAVEREGWSLACEISVTTRVEHEAGNIRKCLAAGFSEVAAISSKQRHLGRLRTALGKTLDGEELSRVHFLTPEEFLAYLETDPGPKEKVETFGGYMVRVNYRPSEKANARTKAVAGVIARSLKRLQRGDEGK